MSEILSFEEFVSKRNEARAVIKDYVIDCYIKKVKEKLLEENPGISQRQLKMKTRQARDSFKDSAKCRELMEAVPLENVSKSLRKAYDTYCEATKKFIAYEKMKKDVVEAIPEQIKDAYPKARLLRRKFILILSRLVDTFFSRISPTMQLPPKHHSIAYVLPWAEGLHWQSRSSGCSNS